jgi:hypothetical protein
MESLLSKRSDDDGGDICEGESDGPLFGDGNALLTSGEGTMANICRACGYTECQAIADAKTLGLQQEFESGIYACCQIAEWADEQWRAWFEATQEDADHADKQIGRPEFADAEPVLVPVRFRRPVPWFRQA